MKIKILIRGLLEFGFMALAWPAMRYVLPFTYPTSSINMKKLGLSSYSDYAKVVFSDLKQVAGPRDFEVYLMIAAGLVLVRACAAVIKRNDG